MEPIRKTEVLDMGAFEILVESFKAMGMTAFILGEIPILCRWNPDDGSRLNPMNTALKPEIRKMDEARAFRQPEKKPNLETFLQECSVVLNKNQAELSDCPIVFEKILKDGSIRLVARMATDEENDKR